MLEFSKFPLGDILRLNLQKYAELAPSALLDSEKSSLSHRRSHLELVGTSAVGVLSVAHNMMRTQREHEFGDNFFDFVDDKVG